MPEVCLVRACLYHFVSNIKSESDKVKELVECKARLSEAGYGLIAFPVNLVSVDSLVFVSICRQVDLFILPANFVCDVSTATMSRRLYEATAYGCRFIFFGEVKEDDPMASTKIQFLKEIGNYFETLTEAVEVAEKLLDVKSIISEAQFDKDLETGKPKVVMSGDNPSTIKYLLMDGDAQTEYKFIETTNLCIPHPFDGESLENKLRFILGYGQNKVLLCGVMRVEGYENTPGYVVEEKTLMDKLPVGWKSRWEVMAYEKGFQVVMQNGWKFAYPPESVKEDDPMIVGGDAFNLNGVHLVQLNPFCLSHFEDEE